MLQGLTAEFDRIQKSLTDYLDTKRSAFPRFYLISDDELLSILGTSDPKAHVLVSTQPLPEQLRWPRDHLCYWPIIKKGKTPESVNPGIPQNTPKQ
eukprot:6201741-Amphidinium_carterae.1